MLTRIECPKFWVCFFLSQTRFSMEKYFLFRIKSNRNQIVFTIFWLIWNIKRILSVCCSKSIRSNAIWFRFDLENISLCAKRGFYVTKRRRNWRNTEQVEPICLDCSNLETRVRNFLFETLNLLFKLWNFYSHFETFDTRTKLSIWNI